MITSERVMAIICRPLSGKELLLTERDNNVIIYRRMEYDAPADSNAFAEFLKKLHDLPIKLMFIFGFGDSIIVNHPSDLNEVNRRLLAL
jgi:hypothetical protein